MAAVKQTVEQVQGLEKYKHGFSSDIEQDFAPKGLNEDTVRFISAKKNEPEWMLEWRLKAFRLWQTMEEPDWAKVGYPKIDYQDAYYYAAPKKKIELDSLDDDGICALPGSAIDCSLDIGLRHRFRSGLLYRRGERGIRVGIASTFASGHSYRSCKLGEELATLGIGGALLVFDR